MAITLHASATSTGTSVTVDIGAAENDRLIVAFLDDESKPSGFSGTVSVDSKDFTQALVANNTSGAGNHLEMHTIDEAGLGISNGSLSISYSGGDSGWAIHVLVFYGVDSKTIVDSGIEETINNSNPVPVENISSNDNSLVVMGAGNGGTGSASAWTSPLTEATDGDYPSSAVFATAWGIETTGQTNKTYEVTIGDSLRSTAIVAVFNEVLPARQRPLIIS